MGIKKSEAKVSGRKRRTSRDIFIISPFSFLLQRFHKFLTIILVFAIFHNFFFKKKKTYICDTRLKIFNRPHPFPFFYFDIITIFLLYFNLPIFENAMILSGWQHFKVNSSKISQYLQNIYWHCFYHNFSSSHQKET